MMWVLVVDGVAYRIAVGKNVLWRSTEKSHKSLLSESTSGNCVFSTFCSKFDRLLLQSTNNSVDKNNTVSLQTCDPPHAPMRESEAKLKEWCSALDRGSALVLMVSRMFANKKPAKTKKPAGDSWEMCGEPFTDPINCACIALVTKKNYTTNTEELFWYILRRPGVHPSQTLLSFAHNDQTFSMPSDQQVFPVVLSPDKKKAIDRTPKPRKREVLPGAGVKEGKNASVKEEKNASVKEEKKVTKRKTAREEKKRLPVDPQAALNIEFGMYTKRTKRTSEQIPDEPCRLVKPKKQRFTFQKR
jgi:hypothetical protein